MKPLGPHHPAVPHRHTTCQPLRGLTRVYVPVVSVTTCRVRCVSLDCTAYAQAHNQRATVLFLMEDFKQSIEVCRLVLDLNPYHFGAASGMGLCHLRLRDYQGALRAFEQALQIHPGLSNAQHFVAEIKEKLAAEEGQQQ